MTANEARKLWLGWAKRVRRFAKDNAIGEIGEDSLEARIDNWETSSDILAWYLVNHYEGGKNAR